MCIEVRLPHGLGVKVMTSESEKQNPIEGCDPDSPRYARIRNTRNVGFFIECDKEEWDAFIRDAKAGRFDNDGPR